MDSVKSIQVSNGYALSYSWNSKRKSLNASALYLDLQAGDGLLTEEFLKHVKELLQRSDEIELFLTFARTLGSPTPDGTLQTMAQRLPLAINFLGETFESLSQNLKVLNSYLGTSPRGVVERNGPPPELAETKGWLRVIEPLSEDLPQTTLDWDLVTKLLENRLTDAERGNLSQKILNVITADSMEIAKIQKTLSEILRGPSHFTKPLSLFRCKCGTLLVEFEVQCPRCREPLSEAPLSVLLADQSLKHIMEKNVWLELAVAKALADAGFETIIGADVLGISGVSHEVDVLAIDCHRGIAFIVEVTMANASVDELANLMVRRADIHNHGAALVTLGPSDDKARKFAKAQGLGLITEVRKNIADLAKWARNHRSNYGIGDSMSETT